MEQERKKKEAEKKKAQKKVKQEQQKVKREEEEKQKAEEREKQRFLNMSDREKVYNKFNTIQSNTLIRIANTGLILNLSFCNA